MTSSPSGSTFAGWPPSQPKTCTRCGKRVLQRESHHVMVIHNGSELQWEIRHLGVCP